MKVKVLRDFKDKYTGQLYAEGSVLEITEERYNEILSVGKFVFKIAQNDAENATSDGVNILSNDDAEALRNDSETSDDGFDIMTIRELKEYADVKYKMTFKAGTKKAEIIEKLRKMERSK